jgi:hypothetical protein
MVKDEDKLVPVLNQFQRHEDVGGEEVQLHAFLTSALDGSGQLQAPVGLSQGKEPLVLIGWEDGWTQRWLIEKESLSLSGIEPLSSSP